MLKTKGTQDNPVTKQAAEDDWAKLQQKEQEYIAGMKSGVAEAEAAPERIRQDREKAVQALRYNLAQTASQSRGLLGGGAGLAAGRQTAAARGAQQSALGAQYGQAERDALRAAAEARTQLAEEEGRLIQQKELRQEKIAAAQTTAKKIIDDVGAVWSTPSERRAARDELIALRDASVDPAVRAVYQKALNKLAGGTNALVDF